MLYELEPSKSITGGAWYSEQDFDNEFAAALTEAALTYIHSKVRLVFFPSFLFGLKSFANSPLSLPTRPLSKGTRTPFPCRMNRCHTWLTFTCTSSRSDSAK